MRWNPKTYVKKRLRWLALGAAGFLVGFTYMGRPATDEMDFLRKFPHSVTVQRLPGERVDTFTYQLQGDSAAIRAAVPGAQSVPPQPSDGATLYEFTLPSGKRATLVAPTGANHTVLVVEGQPKNMLFRAMRRLGL